MSNRSLVVVAAFAYFARARQFDTTDAFEVTGLEVTSDLLEVSENKFRPEQEGGSFIRVKRSSDGSTWEVREKSGLTYRFGGDGCTESEEGKVATWLLRERLDLHGHSIKYTWDTSSGQGLLQRITWNTRSDSSTLTVKHTYESRASVIRTQRISGSRPSQHICAA